MLSSLLGVSAANAVQLSSIGGTRHDQIFDKTRATFGPAGVVGRLGAMDDEATGKLGRRDPGGVTPQDVTAAQRSNLPASGGIPASGTIYGLGTADVGFSVLAADNVHATSFYQRQFLPFHDVSYVLAGTLDATADGAQATADFEFRWEGNDLMNIPPHHGPRDLASSGVLRTGKYFIRTEALMGPGAEVDGFMGGKSSVAFTLNLGDTPNQVPVPGTGGCCSLA